MVSINRKIREIISYYKLSDRQFALKIGVTQSVIGSMFQKDTEPSSKVIQLTASAFPEISLEWFIRGKGDMFKSQNKEIEGTNKLVDTIATFPNFLNTKSGMIDRIKDIIKLSGLSDRAFALKCGINQQTLFNQLKGIRAISLDTVLSIYKTFPDVSTNWLLLGEGDMLKSQSRETERINKLVDTIATLQESINTKSETIALLNEKIKLLESQIEK